MCCGRGLESFLGAGHYLGRDPQATVSPHEKIRSHLSRVSCRLSAYRADDPAWRQGRVSLLALQRGPRDVRWFDRCCDSSDGSAGKNLRNVAQVQLAIAAGQLPDRFESREESFDCAPRFYGGTGARGFLGENVALLCNQMFQETLVEQGFLKLL